MTLIHTPVALTGIGNMGITPVLGTQAAAMFQAALAAGYGGEDDARLPSLVSRQWQAAPGHPAPPDPPAGG
jgi:hypothetical protein